VVTAIPAPGKSMVELEAALLAEIEKLKTESISAADLQRVYAGYLSDDVFQRDSIQSQANSIGVLESSGYSWQLQDDWPQKLKAIVPDQVRQAAKTFLVPSRRSILQLLPVEVAP
jgi:zinc protease